jgi:hypothetical protein
MPAPFEPVSIPLGGGARQDVAELAPDDPRNLLVSENAMFTREGAVRARPARQTRGGTAYLYPELNASPTVTTLSGAGGTLAGMVAATPDTPLCLTQSRAFRRGGGVWFDMGPFWSVRKITSAGIAPAVDQMQVGVGSSLAGVVSTLGLGRGFPHVSTDGQIAALATSTIGPTATAFACAGALLFYQVGTTVYLSRPATYPEVTDTVAATGVSSGAGETFAVTPYGTGAMLAYRTTVVGQFAVTFVSSAGVVATPVTSTTAATLSAISVAVDKAGRVLIAVGGVIASAFVQSSVTTWNGTSFTAITHTLSHNVLAVSLALQASVIIRGGVEYGLVVSSQYTSGGVISSQMLMITRSLTAATVVTTHILYGAWRGTTWAPLFQAVEVAGRSLLGLMRWSSDASGNRVATWYVVDASDLAVSKRVQLVARGAYNGAIRTRPGNATLVGSSLRFGVAEAATFGVDGWETGSAVVVALTPAAAAAVGTPGGLLLSGAAPYVYDGHRTAEAGFADGPEILRTSFAGLSTFVASASYTFQGIWTYVDGTGRTVRSQPTLPATVVMAATPEQLTIYFTCPQLATYRDIRLEVYGTVSNPSAGADLFLVTSGTVTTANDHVAVVLGGYTDAAIQDNPVLYTGGGIIVDEAPPAGDRGIAAVGDKLWVADQRRVYCSKIARPQFAPAWNTEGFLTVEVPASLGTVEGLGTSDDRLVILGSKGIGVVTGPGYDDLGAGPGFSIQQVSETGMKGGPRCAVTTPMGVAFIGTDNQVYLLGQGLQVQNISGPLKLTAATEPDLAYIPGGVVVGDEATTNPLLVCVADVGLRVLDMATGRWSVWRTGSTDVGEGDDIL